MNAGLLIALGDGRIKTSTGAPQRRGPNALPFHTDAICVGVGMTAASWNSGLPLGPSGRIVVQTNNAIPVSVYVAGLGVTASGRLACDTTGAIAGYVRGIPVTKEGRVAIATPLVVADSKDADTLDGPASKE